MDSAIVEDPCGYMDFGFGVHYKAIVMTLIFVRELLTLIETGTMMVRDG
jgi:hypothetical protein